MLLSVKEELSQWADKHGGLPRIILYAFGGLPDEAWELASGAEIEAVCVERGAQPKHEKVLSMAELSALPHYAYDFVIMSARREAIAVLGQQRLEMAGIDFRKIRWFHPRDKEKRICILVSRRIDTASVAVPNPIYLPVRCGAFYDRGEAHIFHGDDTGDNISRYQPYFSEFTVQYWGWKNLEADYYGLCHYRRYLSFADKHFPVIERNFVKEQLLDIGNMEKYGLLDSRRMREVIEGHDAVLNIPAEVGNIHIREKCYQTVWELWAAHDGFFIRKENLKALMEVIEEQEPAYLHSAKEYLYGSLHRGYNCYVLKIALFEELCRLQDSIMRHLFVKFLHDGTLIHYPRATAYMGEILYGIFCQKLVQESKLKIEERQMVEFDDTLLKEYNRGGSAI